MSQATGGQASEPGADAPLPRTRREAREAQLAREAQAAKTSGFAGSPRAGRVGRMLSFLPEWMRVAVVAVALMVLVRALLVQSFSVPSGSMEPTLTPGDRILVSRLVRGPSIERGDVVVFDGSGTWGKPFSAASGSGIRAVLSSVLSFVSLSSGADYVKRVVGLPGDRVVCCDVNGLLNVNGVAVQEPYLYEGNPPSTTAFDVIVPAGKIWVMGDHRSASADSRAQLGRPGGGMVPLDDVVGRAEIRYWPIGRVGSLTPAPSLHDIPRATGAQTP